MRKFIVGVIGPGERADDRTIAQARELGRLVAEQGWVVLSGGRDAGVMLAVNEGAKLVSGSLTVGILPTVDSTPAADVDIVIVTDMHQARNNITVLSSDIVVSCGRGGAGTVSEIALALKNGKTVILMGADAVSVSFFQELGKEKVVAVKSPEQAIAEIKSQRK